MNDPAVYLNQIILALISSPVIHSYEIVRAKANSNDGYLRLRAILHQGDFLELVEYFASIQEQMITLDYRHQWMSGDKTTLRRRWDSTPHHAGLPNFPHHIHVESETNIISGEPMSILQLLIYLENTLLT